MPKPFIYVLFTLVVLALIPPAVIARARSRNSGKTRIHIIQDMDNQAKFRAQQRAAELDDGRSLFRDGRGMRPPVAGTVARGEKVGDEHYVTGVAWGGWANTYPREVDVTVALVRRGQERFNIYCSLCHGYAGYGDGIVHLKAMELVKNPGIGNGTVWVQPKNLHEPEIREQPVGQIYNTITNGIRNMAGYASQIPIEDRWAITAYVEALQRSQNAKPGDIPAHMRENLPLRDLLPPEESDQ